MSEINENNETITKQTANLEDLNAIYYSTSSLADD
jgi:hypothetical protein